MHHSNGWDPKRWKVCYVNGHYPYKSYHIQEMFLNTNADALSHRNQPDPVETTALTKAVEFPNKIPQYQWIDEVTKNCMMSYSCLPPCLQWQHSLFHYYKQIWSQLTYFNKVLCRCYSPGPTSDTIIIPVLPKSLQSTALLSVKMILVVVRWDMKRLYINYGKKLAVQQYINI